MAIAGIDVLEAESLFLLLPKELMLFSGLFEKVDRRIGSEDRALKGVDLLAAKGFVTFIFSICDDFFESFALIVVDQDPGGPLLLTLVSFRFCIRADFKEA